MCPSRSRKEGMTNRKRVLLAEDNEMLRELFTEFLTGEGFDVVAVADGIDAFEAYVDRGPFDAVVSDCDLPRLTGTQLVERLRERRSGVPALLITGRVVLDETEQARLQVGPPLLKPFDLDAFVKALRRLVGWA
jgi:two-component system, OmpR family, response regulator